MPGPLYGVVALPLAPVDPPGADDAGAAPAAEAGSLLVFCASLTSCEAPAGVEPELETFCASLTSADAA